MSRAFNGGTAADRIVCSIGSGPPHQGPITIAALVKPTSASATAWIVDADDGSFVRWGMLLSSGHLFLDNDFGGGPGYASGDWQWMVGTKVSGTTAPRWHVKDITTGGAWSHSDDSSTMSDMAGTATEIIVGGQFTGGASTTWRGSVAVMATWNTALTDLQVEAACTLNAADLVAATPSWMIRLNQASVATAVTDDTGHGGNQTSISGTSVDADDPPGFNYSLTATPTPAGIAVPAAVGQPATGLIGASPAGLPVPAAVGTPSTSYGLSGSPTGLPIAVHLGQPSPLVPSASRSGRPRITTTTARLRVTN